MHCASDGMQVAKVTGYPTVAFFKNGRAIEYKPKGGGGMKAVDIANTAFKKAKKFLKGCRRDPEMVPDPESIRPADWDEEEDGPWAPEMIKNPVCESQAKTVRTTEEVIRPQQATEK